jgi:hypothetical protein
MSIVFRCVKKLGFEQHAPPQRPTHSKNFQTPVDQVITVKDTDDEGLRVGRRKTVRS